MTAAWWLWEIVQLWGSTGFRESQLHLPTVQIPLLAALTAALQHDATARSPNCWILKWNAALPLTTTQRWSGWVKLMVSLLCVQTFSRTAGPPAAQSAADM